MEACSCNSFEDEFEGFESMEGFEGFEEAQGLEGFEEYEGLESEGFEDSWDDLTEGDFGSGIIMPSAPSIVHGPAALRAAQRLNPAMLLALDADESDAFFRRIRRMASRAWSGIRNVAGRVGRGIATVARVAAPLLRRALPMIQRVVGMAGPWGRLISAGIGAARGLAEGRGLRGALAGAVSGAIPGIGGRIAGALLRGDGADDDASVDLLADMAQTRQVAPALALPMGAALATRAATRQAMQLAGSAATPCTQGVWNQARALEPSVLRTLTTLPGTVDQRLRLVQLAARAAAENAAVPRSPAATARALPAAMGSALTQVRQIAQTRPDAGRIPAAVAAHRIAERQRVLRCLTLAAR